MKAFIFATAAALLVAGPVFAQAPVQRGDANGDGALSASEFKALQAARLTRLDGDGDGKVSQAEWAAQPRGGQAGRRGGDPARAFGLLDRNHDGGLDRGEIDALLQRRFDRLDANSDGRLTPAERQAQMAGARGRRATP